jgi:PIN domain nuclease of toxin-antitoxin system
MADAGAKIVPVSDEHAMSEAALETSNPDPFDRLLFAVAVTEHMTSGMVPPA